MKIAIVLSGTGGELDRQELFTTEEKASKHIGQAVRDAAEDWILSPGDTIRIETVE